MFTVSGLPTHNPPVRQEQKLIDGQPWYSVEKQFPIRVREFLVPFFSVVIFSGLFTGMILRMPDKDYLFLLVMPFLALGTALYVEGIPSPRHLNGVSFKREEDVIFL